MVNRLPKKEYPRGDYPQTTFITRESYERALRDAVLKAAPRIRWLSGTVTGLNASPNDFESVKSVNVRTADKSEKEISAALVIG